MSGGASDRDAGIESALASPGDLVSEWVQEQLSAPTARPELISRDDVARESAEFMELFARAVAEGGAADTHGAAWDETREWLAALSRSRAERGFSPSETAIFVLSVKRPLFERIIERMEDPRRLGEELQRASLLIDRLGLLTIERHQAARDAVIVRQQEELLELSTPVVRLWEGIVAVPLIGTLDSNRTQVVMESLLEALVATGSELAIIDITGVPTVDTLVAQHLLKTVAAARLMGAECIISGIRPQIAQTIVQLGISLSDVVTKATLADAITAALARAGWRIERASAANP